MCVSSTLLLLCHTGTSVHLLPPPPGYWYTSFFFMAGPGHPHQIAVSAFSQSPLGRANTCSFLYLLSIPRISLKCFSDFTLFPNASLSPLPIRFSTSALYPTKISAGGGEGAGSNTYRPESAKDPNTIPWYKLHTTSTNSCDDYYCSNFPRNAAWRSVQRLEFVARKHALQYILNTQSAQVRSGQVRSGQVRSGRAADCG